jgi:MYXO-CTERM domain-containing protein
VWLASACNVVSSVDVVAYGGEPRGGVIKVVLGLAILALVLSWALRRKARGTRPRLPGAPEP